LPRLSSAQTLLMQVLERQAAAPREAAPDPGPPAEMSAARAAGPAAGWGDEPLAEPAAASAGGVRSAPPPAPAEPAGDLDDIWSLPRLISLHRK
jgi:hypothetical protein